jgi:hypothetical protein
LRLTIAEGPGIVTWEEKAPIYCRNYVLNGVDEHLLLTLGVFALWIRVISYAKYNEYLGRFFGIVKRIVSEISLFFVLYLINLLWFALLSETSFREFDEYNTTSKAFKTLFFASFGTFDFERIQTARLGDKFGVSFLLFFLIINIGLFMSLFVSIITVLFHEYKKNENVYQMIETLRIRPQTQADK